MRVPVLCGLLLAGIPLFAEVPSLNATPWPVTVIVDFEEAHSAISLNAIKRELRDILTPIGLDVDLKVKSELPEHSEFHDLVVFKMKGHCTMDPWPVAALSDERGPLAMTHLSDGEMLPFGEVECDHVREILQRVLGKRVTQRYEEVYGTALGLVMAHEAYHMLAKSVAHTKSGVTKEAVSARDLLDGNLALPPSAQEAIRKALDSHVH